MYDTLVSPWLEEAAAFGILTLNQGGPDLESPMAAQWTSCNFNSRSSIFKYA